MSESSLLEQLKSHMGGLVRVRCDDGYANSLNGKIGLLMSASEAERDDHYVGEPMQIEVLIDGSVRILLLYPHELELLGADDV